VGQEEKVAIAGSLAIVAVIAGVASLPYIRDRLVEWRSVVMFGLPGMAGTYLGAWASVLVSGEVQLAVFAAVMLAAAWFMLKPRDLDVQGARRDGLHIALTALRSGPSPGLSEWVGASWSFPRLSFSVAWTCIGRWRRVS
tara:strand:+ start:216 stop:635 length:420 start_codon:yes stop_codon:yes gene_type:complete